MTPSQQIARFRALLKNIQYKAWNFVLHADGDRVYLQLQWDGTCNFTGKPYANTSRKWMLSEHMTDSEFVGTCFFAVKTAEEHELRESFKWRDRAIYNTHTSIDALYDACVKTDVRKEPPKQEQAETAWGDFPIDPNPVDTGFKAITQNIRDDGHHSR